MNSKVVYITGGTKGIGYGIAEVLLQNGYQVAISGRSKEGVDSAINQLQEISSNILGVVSDVTQYEDEVKAVESIVAHFGRLDISIANAGLGIFSSVEDMEVEDWKAMIDTNLSGVFYTLKSSVAQLKQNKGYFISIASLAGINFFEKGSGYNASKFGVVGFTQAAMLDLRKYDVKVTTILPGSVTSHFNNNEPSDKDSWKITPQDVGILVLDILKMNSTILPSKIEIRPLKTHS